MTPSSNVTFAIPPHYECGDRRTIRNLEAGSDLEAEEADLIDSARRDVRHFEPLYDRYHPRIYLFVVRRCGSKDLAADLTQQTFLKAMLGLPKYDHGAVPFGAWLFRIALNEVRMHWRKRKEVIMDVDRKDVLRLTEEMEFPEDDDLLRRSMEVLSRMEVPKARLIELRFLDGLSFREVGEVLGIGEDAAKMRTHRVLKELRALLGVGT